MQEQIIRLETGTTKNKKGRVVKMTNTVFQLLERCCTGKGSEDHLSTRDGKPVGDFRGTWGTAVRLLSWAAVQGPEKSGSPNMVRAGIPEHQAMKISGHKTRSVFDRYEIVNERDISDSVQKLELHHAKLHTAHSCIQTVPIEKPRSG